MRRRSFPRRRTQAPVGVLRRLGDPRGELFHGVGFVQAQDGDGVGRLGKLLREVGADPSRRGVRPRQLGVRVLQRQELVEEPVVFDVGHQGTTVHVIRVLVPSQEIRQLRRPLSRLFSRHGHSGLCNGGRGDFKGGSDPPPGLPPLRPCGPPAECHGLPWPRCRLGAPIARAAPALYSCFKNASGKPRYGTT